MISTIPVERALLRVLAAAIGWAAVAALITAVGTALFVLRVLPA